MPHFEFIRNLQEYIEKMRNNLSVYWLFFMILAILCAPYQINSKWAVCFINGDDEVSKAQVYKPSTPVKLGLSRANIMFEILPDNKHQPDVIGSD